MTTKRYPAVFKFRGGHVALDFCNTVHWRRKPDYIELLTDYGRLVDWALQAGVVSRTEAGALRGLARRQRRRAEAVRRQAVAVRDALHRLLAAHAAGVRPASQDRATVSRALAQAGAQAELRPTPVGYAFIIPTTDLSAILWRVVLAARPLVAGPELARVGQCQDPRGCGWLFLDTTRNHSRRWCSMSDCGSLDKARRYYHRRIASSLAQAASD